MPIREVLDDGCRLTGAYHLSEDQIAVSRLRAFRGPTSRVSELVRDRGVFKGPMFKRIYVEDPAFGEPYVSARDLVMADVRPSSFLTRRLGALLDDLRLQEGMILVTRSGMNLGSAIWTRQDLDGLVASDDLIRICPDPHHVPPGYLHAFLASRYGRALIRKQIYGGNIKHVEPQHIAALPVPRPSAALERQVHELVMEASAARSGASRIRAQVTASVSEALGWGHVETSGLANAVQASATQRRMDAFHHGGSIAAARACLAHKPSVRLGDVVAEVFEPGRAPRRVVEDVTMGVPFLSSSSVFQLDPKGEYAVSRKLTPHLDRQLVGDRDLLLPRSGQVGGIIGRAVLPLPTYYGSAASEHLVRVRCRSREDAYFAWALFSTQPGYKAAIGTAYGTSIPSLDCDLLADLRVPWWSDDRRHDVVEAVGRMVQGLADAIRADRDAVSLVERAIEEGT